MPSLKSLLTLLTLAPLAAIAQPTPAALEALNRQDFTGEGSFHRINMFRQQGEAVTKLKELAERLSGQVHANTMFFASDNIFNTPNNEQSGSQLAEFLGGNVRVSVAEQLKLNTSYDFGFFRHQKRGQRSNDIDTRTFRQQLSYEKLILNNKVSVGVPLTWQHSTVLTAGSSDRIARTWTYSSGVDVTWFATKRAFPSFSYTYFLSDPKVGAGRHKHDFNLGVTIIPLPGTKLFIIPSVQYNYEDFRESNREDKAWTPTLTASYTPLKFLAFDAVGSYTDSDSTSSSARFQAWTSSIFARVFWNW